jgi:hypothetical protein
MKSQTELAGLTMAQFWSDFNWFGRPVELIADESPDTSDWMQLELKTFFQRANWDGRSQYQPTVKQPPKNLSLTLSVEEYFQFHPWRGQANIAVTPAKSSSSSTTSRNLNVTDLANLF